ncbi:NUDIX hydrolase [Acidovorax sp. NCPPB 4044]|uniref:NUDIX hydrolase n=1 Tax=Acidovorax sp. NCPPB 4044 TaxID=2940490 RepID=UPI0023034091|nr:NUDIX domain-containing protein [Acidovorax sp. NCPPB 4044]MDA8522404.1 NUDIX domain-containing protein [Acidovorax sp. NCPPB 4044]
MAPSPPDTDFTPILCTVDVVLLTLEGQELHAVLMQRPHGPCAGAWALPGGYIHAQEDGTAWDAAARVLQHKVGIASPYLEQLATYSGAGRDPRGWSVSIVYCALVPAELLPASAPGLRRAPVHRLPPLAFDHADMVALAVSRVRSKSQYSSLPVYFCGERMTLPQLQAVYEAVLGEPVNKVSFRRKIDELGMLEPIEGVLESGAAHRPAQVYRLRPPYRRALSLVARGLNA